MREEDRLRVGSGGPREAAAAAAAAQPETGDAGYMAAVIITFITYLINY